MDDKKPYWTKEADFSGAKKVMETADQALIHIQEMFELKRQELVALQKKMGKHGNT